MAVRRVGSDFNAYQISQPKPIEEFRYQSLLTVPKSLLSSSKVDQTKQVLNIGDFHPAPQISYTSPEDDVSPECVSPSVLLVPPSYPEASTSMLSFSNSFQLETDERLLKSPSSDQKLNHQHQSVSSVHSHSDTVLVSRKDKIAFLPDLLKNAATLKCTKNIESNVNSNGTNLDNEKNTECSDDVICVVNESEKLISNVSQNRHTSL